MQNQNSSPQKSKSLQVDKRSSNESNNKEGVTQSSMAINIPSQVGRYHAQKSQSIQTSRHIAVKNWISLQSQSLMMQCLQVPQQDKKIQSSNLQQKIQTNMVQIGQGSHAKVYRIEIEGKQYALKQMPRHTSNEMTLIKLDNIFSNQLSDEINQSQIKIHNKLEVQQQNGLIIKRFGKYKSEDYYNIIQEYCNGGDLRQFLHSYTQNNSSFNKKGLLNCQLRESIAQIIIQQVTQCLQHLHEQRRVVHCDIQPSTILLSWSLQNLKEYERLEDFSKALNLNPQCLKVKLSDFSFARLLSESQEQAFGKPQYLSPEVLKAQLRNISESKKQKSFKDVDYNFLEDEYDYKSDIWSLGLTLYEILTDCGIEDNSTSVPFYGSTREEILAKIKTGQYLIDQTLYPSTLSPYCIDFINHCLQQYPENRASATQLLNHPFLSIEWRQQKKHFRDNFSLNQFKKIYPLSQDGKCIMMNTRSKLFLVDLDYNIGDETDNFFNDFFEQNSNGVQQSWWNRQTNYFQPNSQINFSTNNTIDNHRSHKALTTIQQQSIIPTGGVIKWSKTMKQTQSQNENSPVEKTLSTKCAISSSIDAPLQDDRQKNLNNLKMADDDEDAPFDLTDCSDLQMDVAFQKCIPSMNTYNATKILFTR